jgi:zona occludens toxin
VLRSALATLQEFPDLPESFDVIHVEDSTEEGRQKWARWFHWVPLGAFIFLDEAQDIFPKSWRDADLERLNYPGGVEQATADGRPFNWAQAWDKHRHYNWDFVLTTPAYKKIRDDIKSVADAAYKHKNLALIGWRGRYIEAMHLADDTGAYQSDFLNVVNKKVPSYVFKLYDSTSTGAFSETSSGTSLFKNPKVMFFMVVLTIALLVVLYFGRSFSLAPPPARKAAGADGMGAPIRSAAQGFCSPM